MKKFSGFLIAGLTAGALIAAPAAQAQDKITMKGIGISGYVDAAVGLSRTSSDWTDTGSSLPGTYAGAIPIADGFGPNETDFSFAATELKLHFNQDFADKATAVASLSIASSANGTGSSAGGDFTFDLQQAFVKLNFGDSHFLLGRFYAPIGIESVDANSRPTITLGNVFNNLEPFYLTGAMLHYAPEEGVGGFIYIANSLGGANFECNPNTGTPPPNCLGSPAELGKALAAGVTYVGGGASVTFQYNVDWAGNASTGGDVFEDATQIIDLSVLFDSDGFMAGMDAIYHRDNAGASNADIFGIEIMGAAKMDSLIAGVRADAIKSIDPAAVGVQPDGKIIMVSPFVTYTVIDGVFVRGEYRYDASDPADLGDWEHANVFLVQANASFQ